MRQQSAQRRTMHATFDQWSDDLLGRKQDAEFVYNFLIGQSQKRRSGSYVMNIDADWGGGKSYFLKRLAADIRQNGHIAVEINAWKDDHGDDAYIAIMAGINAAFEPYVRKKSKFVAAWEATKRSGGTIALRTTGAIAKGAARKLLCIEVNDLVASISGDGSAGDIIKSGIGDADKAIEGEIGKLFDASLEGLIRGFSQAEAAIANFNVNLEAAINAISAEKRLPLFVLVDELDRCRPTYAVQLLERIKHLFDVPNLVFVFATNTDQLRHSIAGAYGSGFDGQRYLKRFFDRTYAFSPPALEDYVRHLLKDIQAEKLRAPQGKLAEVLVSGFRLFAFDLRAIAQIFDIMDATASVWPHRVPIEISLLFPLCAHFYRTGKAEWPSDNFTPSSWRLEWFSTNPITMQRQKETIELFEVYRRAVWLMNDLELAVSESSGAVPDETRRYVNEVFLPEWNGQVITPGQPSVQRELLGLVANAGRMIGNRSGQEYPSQMSE